MPNKGAKSNNKKPSPESQTSQGPPPPPKNKGDVLLSKSWGSLSSVQRKDIKLFSALPLKKWSDQRAIIDSFTLQQRKSLSASAAHELAIKALSIITNADHLPQYIRKHASACLPYLQRKQSMQVFEKAWKERTEDEEIEALEQDNIKKRKRLDTKAEGVVFDVLENKLATVAKELVGSDEETKPRAPPKRVRMAHDKSNNDYHSQNTPQATPNKPKLQAAHFKKLSELVHIALSTSTSLDTLPQDVRDELNHSILQRRAFGSLKRFKEVHKLVLTALQREDYYTWLGWLHGQVLPEHCEKEEHTLWRIMQSVLTAFWLKVDPTYSLCSPLESHERTLWISRVVPLMEPLQDKTDLVQFVWGEYPIASKSFNMLAQNDYDVKACPSKYADGIGLHRTDRSELIFMESSSGLAKERVGHSIGDTLKIMESSIHSLTRIMSENKDASFKTMQRRCVMGIQCIKDRLTLTSTSAYKDGRYWKTVELRNAVIPLRWDERMRMMGLLELLATMYVVLLEQKDVTKIMDKELYGMRDIDGPTVRDVMNPMLRTMQHIGLGLDTPDEQVSD